MVILKICSLLLWLIGIPFLIGTAGEEIFPAKERGFGTIFITGYLIQFALFELIGIPVVLFVVYHGFSWLCGLFLAASLILSGIGIRKLAKSKKREEADQKIRKPDLTECLLYIVFFVILGFQLYMAVTRASFDGDDAYYGVQGLIAQQQDTLYRINPYTGRSAPLDERHAMALIPIWEAFIGRVSGIHVTILAHSVIPLIFIPLSDLLYFQIGKKLLKDNQESLPVFMILIAVFQIFGNVSIQTAETFLLTRTWQGKSLTGNFMIPAVFWIFLCLMEEEKKESWKGFVLLAILNLAAGISSSLAVLLTLALSAGLGILTAWKRKNAMLLIHAGLACIPGAAYILVYLLVR